MTPHDFIQECGYDEGWVYMANYTQAAVWLHTPRLSPDPAIRRLEDEMCDYYMEAPFE